MDNYGIGFADDFNSSAERTHSLSIIHYQLSIRNYALVLFCIEINILSL